MRERLTHPKYVAEPRPTAGRLSTVGHAEALHAFCRVARRLNLRFLVIGGTFADAFVGPKTTRDIDVVLVDRPDLPGEAMAAEGFAPVAGTPFTWRHGTGGSAPEIQVAAVISAAAPDRPFAVAAANAVEATIEGETVLVPLVEDWVILKLFAVADEPRRTHRDLYDIQRAIEAFPEHRDSRLSVPGIRARLRDLYGATGPRLRDLAARYRAVHRLATPPPRASR